MRALILHICIQLTHEPGKISTLEGVLEVRNTHFWCVSYGAYAGTMNVRVRRDADEQQVRDRIHRKLKEAGLMLPKFAGMASTRPHTPAWPDASAAGAAFTSPFYSPATSSFAHASGGGHNVEWCIQVVKDQW